jgi:uncharacterized membrane protein YfcA
MTVETDWQLYAGSMLTAGLVSGFAGGLFGIGGGPLRIPIFLYLFPLFGVDPTVVMHLSVGTSLALGIPTTSAASVSQYRAGNLELPFLRSWILALLVGVLLGLAIVRLASDRFLVSVFVVALAAEAAYMLLARDDFRLTATAPTGVKRGLVAASIGTLSTMLGISGGTFVTPILSACSYPIHRAIAVGTAGGVVISLVGAAGSVVNGLGVAGRPSSSVGYVDLIAFGVMTPAVMMAAPLGVRVANRFDPHRLRIVFGVFLTVIALDMLRNLVG